MAVITTTTPLSAKDLMKLADRLIEVSSETISRRERVFEERMEQMERKNRILEEKLLLMTTPKSEKNDGTDDAKMSSERVVASFTSLTSSPEGAAEVQKTLFTTRQQQQQQQQQETTTKTTSKNHHHLPSHTPGIPSISLSPPRGQTMRADASEFSPPFSNSRRYTNNNNNNNNDNNNFYNNSRSSLRSTTVTPLSFRNKENILMRKLAAAAASSTSSLSSTMKEEKDPRQSLLHAAERTMAQSVDDLQNLKAANDALRNDLEKMKKQRDADAESYRKALAESNAETRR